MVRTDDPQQCSQRHERRPVPGTEGLQAGLTGIGGAAQRDAVVRLERNQQCAQRARALRLGLAMAVEALRSRWRSGVARRPARVALDTAGECGQQLAAL